ncbi:flagellar basal body-associated FliL family protein [Azotobacter armeniacus]
MLRIELTAAASGQPGYGELTVRGWPGNTDGLELSVLRNQDSLYLDAGGGWGSLPAWHAIDGLERRGELLLGTVGPWLVDPLVRDPKMVYRLQLRDAGQSDGGVLRIVGNILSSPAVGHPQPLDERPSEPPAAPPEPESEPELPAEEVVEPPPVETPRADRPLVAERDEEFSAAPAPKPRKPARWLPLVAGLMLLIGVGLAAYWYFVLRPQEDTPAVASTPAAAVVGEAGACGETALEGIGDDLAFIQACLRSNPSSAQVLEVIDAAKQSRRCGVVQRLYAHKAQAGDAAIAFAYAREYDPQSFAAGGCVESADAETAAYWYEIALANDPANADARKRLEALKP